MLLCICCGKVAYTELVVVVYPLILFACSTTESSCYGNTSFFRIIRHRTTKMKNRYEHKKIVFLQRSNCKLDTLFDKLL